MSTNCSISARIDGKVKTIYCHWDGYPNHTGVLLYKHYNTEEIVKELIDLGDISFLDESISCPKGHSYNTPIKGFTVFYGRDRGEDFTEARVYENCYEMLKREHQEYNYLFDEGKWYVNGRLLEEEIADKIKKD